MLKTLVTLAHYEDGPIVVSFPKDLADKVGRLEAVKYSNDDKGARLELRPAFNGVLGRAFGRRYHYRFKNKTTQAGAPFYAAPATLSIDGEKLVIEVDKVRLPLTDCLRELLEAV